MYVRAHLLLPLLLSLFLLVVLMSTSTASSSAPTGDVVKLINAFRGLPRAEQATFLAQIDPQVLSSNNIRYPEMPPWYLSLRAQPNSVVVDEYVPEYNDEAWRLSPESGFGGTDLMHSSSRSPVRVLQYTLLKAPEGVEKDALPYPRLVGAAYFSEAAEGHKGLCHGGSMCALCDDALGWIGFCADGSVRPWAGYTVQVLAYVCTHAYIMLGTTLFLTLFLTLLHKVDTTLKKSVPTGSLLKIEAWVERREGPRKVWAECRLSDADDGTVYCTGKGLVLLKPEYATAGPTATIATATAPATATATATATVTATATETETETATVAATDSDSDVRDKNGAKKPKL